MIPHLHLEKSVHLPYLSILSITKQPVCPKSALRPAAGGTCPKHLIWEVSRRHPVWMTEPVQLGPFDVKQQHAPPV